MRILVPVEDLEPVPTKTWPGPQPQRKPAAAAAHPVQPVKATASHLKGRSAPAPQPVTQRPGTPVQPQLAAARKPSASQTAHSQPTTPAHPTRVITHGFSAAVHALAHETTQISRSVVDNINHDRAKVVQQTRAAASKAKEAVLEVGQEIPYGAYYASYEILGITSTGSRALNIAADLLTPRKYLVIGEAAGLGGNIVFDSARGKSMWDDARVDSILPNFVAKHWNPKWLRTYLPGGGTRGDGSHFIDFRY